MVNLQQMMPEIPLHKILFNSSIEKANATTASTGFISHCYCCASAVRYNRWIYFHNYGNRSVEVFHLGISSRTCRKPGRHIRLEMGTV